MMPLTDSSKNTNKTKWGDKLGNSSKHSLYKRVLISFLRVIWMNIKIFLLKSPPELTTRKRLPDFLFYNSLAVVVVEKDEQQITDTFKTKQRWNHVKSIIITTRGFCSKRLADPDQEWKCSISRNICWFEEISNLLTEAGSDHILWNLSSRPASIMNEFMFQRSSFRRDGQWIEPCYFDQGHLCELQGWKNRVNNHRSWIMI